MFRFFIFYFLIVTSIGCKTYSYFNGPNDIGNKKICFFLADGNAVEGKVSIQFESGHYHPDSLRIFTQNQGEKIIAILDVRYFTYENAYYYPKELNVEAYDIPMQDKVYHPNIANLLFVKRMTDDGAKIQLFELYKSSNNAGELSDQYEYYFSFPRENRYIAWNIRSSKLFPDFKEKMYNLIKDCPSVAEKVKKEHSGYVMKQLPVDAQKIEVIKRIISEYNQCK